MGADDRASPSSTICSSRSSATPPRRWARSRSTSATLPDLDEVDAIVSFGGEQSAWDPELEPEVELIREAVAREIPFLGVCLGAQLLAHALGGEVSRLPNAASSPGRRSTVDRRATRCSARSRRTPTRCTGTRTASSRRPARSRSTQRPQGGRAEGFRVGRLAWGVQFHPEVDPAALDGWYAAWGERA